MQGFMRQRGSSWELRVYLGRDVITGRRQYATQTVRGGKREAQRTLAAMVTEADRGVLTHTSATVGDLLEQWFHHAEADFSPKTVREVRGFIDRNLIPALGAVPLKKLKAGDIDRYYRMLRASGAKTGEPLAPATIRRIHGIVRRALEQGVRWGWIADNPAARASPPRVPVSEIRPPAPADVVRLFAEAGRTAPDLATFVIVSAATGARRSETIALRWADVDLRRGVITIARGIVVGPEGLVEKDTKTHSTRRVSVDATTTAALVDHRTAMEQRAAMGGEPLASTAFVFSHDLFCEEPWRPDSVSRAFRQLCERTGLQGVRLHDLRHYVATRLLASGVDVRTVAGRLGHRNAATTLNVYSHFVAEADQDAADLLGRIFDNAAVGRLPSQE
jgi:integrase